MGSRASYATGIPEIAAHVHLSEAYFKSKFKRELGVTPRRYLIDKIMEKAKRDLSSTDRSVTEIAFDYGFSSSSYFSSVFRQETGLTPRAYRSLCGRSGMRA